MAKKLTVAVVAVFFALALALAPTPASTLTSQASAEYYPPENWEITDFHTSIFINDDATLRVTETIQADFTNERHHGIIRSIPYKYQARFGTTKSIKLRLIEAVDSSNEPWKTSVSKEDGYYNMRIETQDGSYLTGPATFHITYEVERAMNFFTEEDNNGAPEFFPHDELYWNITGVEWVVPIRQASAEIHYPIPVEKQNLKYLCYTGPFGSIDQNCKISVMNDTTVEFKTTNPLATYEGLTAVLALPPGTITPPSAITRLAWFFSDNWPLFTPIFVLFAMFLLWFFKGRDPDIGRDTVIPHYKPPRGLKPTECGIIIDERLHPRDITSTIIDLAVRGYIKIEETEKKGLLHTKTDHKLTLLKNFETLENAPELLDFEQKVLKGLFTKTKQSVLISDLKNSFYTHVPGIKKSVMDKLVKDAYFPSSPAKTRGRYMGFGIAILVITMYLGELLFAEYGPLMIFSLLASAGIVIAFGYFMPRKTHKGRETYYELKGLYEYINTAEKDRMVFQEKANIFFEKLLPYAAAFGLTKKWTKAFDGLLKEPPRWYCPMHGHVFTYLYFSDQLDSMTASAASNMASRPGGAGGSGFGGGGFSGGGFGGGGGRGI
ncbi:MAG: DUF2207 domain-containing protein [Candidatus Gracilibacteria bacterium]